MNGYRSGKGNVICYKNKNYTNYMLWYQRIHLCLYSALPSTILFILNALLMRTIFESKRRLRKHTLHNLPSMASPSLNHHSKNRSLRQASITSSSSSKKLTKPNTARALNRHSRKLTLSLIFITLSYFILTFPSTVIFSFFRSFIEPLSLRRTVSLLFTNLSTTTHVIRFFIYYFCSIDFRNDFYNLISLKKPLRLKYFTRNAHRNHM